MRVEDEILRNKLITSRIELYFALQKFCEEMKRYDPCPIARDCEDCPIRRKIIRLRDYAIQYEVDYEEAEI